MLKVKNFGIDENRRRNWCNILIFYLLWIIWNI